MSTMIEHVGYIDLPSHVGRGGFDHGAVSARTGHIYVAHTANDAVDVIDPAAGRYLHSIGDLRGVAGVLVSDEWQLVVTSNRRENTIGIFALDADPDVAKVAVGLGPNGLACDPARRLILVANVGDAAVPGSRTLSVVALDERAVLTEIPVPGRTRWVVYDGDTENFYVNIADPAQIVIISSREPGRINRSFAVPAGGPHGLDIDLATHRLFCACDTKTLVSLDARSGSVLGQSELSGVPDVIFLNAHRQHLYVAIGDPGVIDVLDSRSLRRVQTVSSERGAHTLAFAAASDRLYAFLAQTHRVAVYREIER
jgi:DNA-binding beta-propeller fold protein YncE